MLDHFIYGQVERISPEAPIPVLKQNYKFSVLGGAGNVMRNLLSLGGEVIFISVIGDDEAGHDLQEQIQKLNSPSQNLDTQNSTYPELNTQDVGNQNVKVQAELIVEPHRQTIQKTRFIAQGQQLLRVDEEKLVSCQIKTEQEILRLVEQHLPTCQAVVLSDYNKGLLSENLTKDIIDLIKQSANSCPIVVDPKGKTYSRYQGATIITPNLKELTEVAGYTPSNQEGIIEVARSLQQKFDIESVLVTQGAQGMTLIEKTNPPQSFPAQAREVYDVSGAGDTVVATLALALANGYSLQESCLLANQAAGVVVGKVGTATLSREELEQSLNQNFVYSPSHKIVDRHQAQDVLKLWRHQGAKVGFMNGCFDLLHLGHLHSLNQAAQRCDKLIIGLNSDASVKRLKGEQRPIQDQHTRASVLAALTMIDEIILFEEDTPYTLIQALQPDILFKGADYRLDQVVGADIVHARGGTVVLLDLFEGHSTTKTVHKIKGTVV